MEIINKVSGYHEQISCDFCSITFDTNVEKNVHTLNHFEHEFCAKCDQNLIRIGGNLYVLHGAITCIDIRVKQEICSTPVDAEENQTDHEHFQRNDQYIDVLHGKTEPVDLFREMNTQIDLDNVMLNNLHTVPQTYPSEIDQLVTENHMKPEKSTISYHSRKSYVKLSKEQQLLKTTKQKSQYQCDICKKSFTNFHSLRYHMTSHGANGLQYHCKVCGCSNLSEETLRHRHSKKIFDCLLCEKRFCLRKDLNQHKLDVHSSDSKSVTESDVMQTIDEISYKNNVRKNVPIKGYTCSICGTANLNKDNLLKHLNNQSIDCPLCNERFCMKNQLKLHNIKVHFGGKMPRKRPKLEMYTCPIDGCHKVLNSGSRSAHMEAIHGTMRFECDICKKICSAKHSIRIHILKHHVPSSKKFKCELCEKSFLTNSLLQIHMKIAHIKPQDFVCSECGVTFVGKHNLTLHMTKHTGEKPYVCTFDGCTKAFRYHGRRKEHMRSHTGEKPFLCSIDGCERRFAYAIDFKRHKFSAHGIFTKKFPCQICAEIFPENRLLKIHMNKHKVKM